MVILIYKEDKGKINEKIKKIIISIVMILLFLITVSISIINRALYGTWSVFSYPERVTCVGYSYDNSQRIVVLTDDEKPQYEISRNIDKFTGKRIYSKKKDFISGYGKMIYLHLDGDRYFILVSGGGG